MTHVMPAPVDGCARRGRPRDERIDSEIVAAAVAELADVGFERFSVEAVSARAGVAKTTVYRRFPARADLIGAALEHLGDEPTPTVTGSVRDQVRAILTAIRDSTPGSPRWRILMHAFGSGDAEMVEMVHARVLSGRSTLLRATIARGVATGEFRADLDVDAAIALLVGPMIYLGMWRTRASTQHVSVDEALDLLMTGLTPASGS